MPPCSKSTRLKIFPISTWPGQPRQRWRSQATWSWRSATSSRLPPARSRCPYSTAWSPPTPTFSGGAVTTRKGELLGIIGKEVRNSLSDTWINYAVPVPVLADFVEKGKKGEYRAKVRVRPTAGPAGYHGIILVPNVVERTPTFVED